MYQSVKDYQNKFAPINGEYRKQDHAVRAPPSKQGANLKAYTEVLTSTNDLGKTKSYELEKDNVSYKKIFLTLKYSAVTGGTSNQSLVEGPFLASRMRLLLGGNEIRSIEDNEIYEYMIENSSKGGLRRSYIMDVADRRLANVANQEVVLDITPLFQAIHDLSTNTIFEGSGKTVRLEIAYRSASNICQSTAAGAIVTLTGAELTHIGERFTPETESDIVQAMRTGKLVNHYLQPVKVYDSTISTTGTQKIFEVSGMSGFASSLHIHIRGNVGIEAGDSSVNNYSTYEPWGADKASWGTKADKQLWIQNTPCRLLQTNAMDDWDIAFLNGSGTYVEPTILRFNASTDIRKDFSKASSSGSYYMKGSLSEQVQLDLESAYTNAQKIDMYVYQHKLLSFTKGTFNEEETH